MDELIDILDVDGDITGKTCLKSKAHRLGYWHPCVHIWFYTGKQEVLIQKRIKTKDTFPNLWDVSVAGHIGAGEIPTEAALREVQEEIGLKITSKELKWIGNFKSDVHHSELLIDREYHHIYIAKLSVHMEELTIQKEEVSEVKLISIEALEELIKKGQGELNFVPHTPEYFDMVFKAIRLKYE